MNYHDDADTDNLLFEEYAQVMPKMGWEAVIKVGVVRGPDAWMNKDFARAYRAAGGLVKAYEG